MVAVVPQFRRSKHMPIRSLPLCVGWLVFEQANYLTTLDTSFPWLNIGYAFSDTWLVALAPIGGITLVSAAVVTVTLGLLMLPSMPRLGMVVVGVPWFASASLLQQEWTHPDGELEVALVQANVSLAEKFDNDGAVLAWDAHAELSMQAKDADLVVWPEGSVPMMRDQVSEHIHLLAQQLNSPVLAGVYIDDEVPDDRIVYNGALAIEPVGRSKTFLKYKRVPFGEYTPFAWILAPIQKSMNIPNSGIREGPLHQSSVSLDCCSLGLSICYEVAFPYLISQRAQDSDFLVSISEDGWFGNSMGPAQHMQIARMRAIETQRYVIRATSSGITGVIDPNGKLVAKLPTFERGVLISTIEARTGSTPYMKVVSFAQDLIEGFFPG